MRHPIQKPFGRRHEGTTYRRTPSLRSVEKSDPICLHDRPFGPNVHPPYSVGNVRDREPPPPSWSPRRFHLQPPRPFLAPIDRAKKSRDAKPTWRPVPNPGCRGQNLNSAKLSGVTIFAGPRTISPPAPI